MRKFVIAVVGLVLFSAVLSGAAFAQQYPNVSNLTPFSAQANFMSLPGYLRYLAHQQSGQWLTYTEASRIVSQQKGQ